MSRELDGSINDSLFVIYTNADLTDLQSNKHTDTDEESLLMTGGSVLQFNEQEHDAIYRQLKHFDKHSQFFCRFRIMYNQTDEENMERHIKSELNQTMKLHCIELDRACMYLLDCMRKWWQSDNVFLTHISTEKDPLLKTSLHVKLLILSEVFSQRISELDKLSIKYKESSITDMKQLTEPYKALLIRVSEPQTTFTAAKIHQMLGDVQHVILKLEQLIKYKSEVIFAWKNVFDVLVIESDGTAKIVPDFFKELSDFLITSVAEKKFIFISSSEGNIELRSAFQTNFKEDFDYFKLTDIVPEDRKKFLYMTSACI
jgi:hypothetical protein